MHAWVTSVTNPLLTDNPFTSFVYVICRPFSYISAYLQVTFQGLLIIGQFVVIFFDTCIHTHFVILFFSELHY